MSRRKLASERRGLPSRPAGRRKFSHGFTLLELLVVVAIISVLVAMLMPSLHAAREAARRAQCGSSVRQLTYAWRQYSITFDRWLVDPMTYDEQGWVDAGNTIEAIEDGALYPYVGGETGVYQCPADDRRNADGDPILRSYSISHYTGGRGGWNVDSVTKQSRIRAPSETLVFLGEPDPRGWNLGSWVITVDGDKWIDWPAAWHGGGVNLSFADGHVEYYHHVEYNTPRIQSFYFRAPGSRDLEYFQRIYVPR